MLSTGSLSGFISRTLDKASSGLRRVARNVAWARHSFYSDTNPSYKACTLIAGTGRGGTTWLAEVLNHDNSYRFMFEPFYPARVRAAAVFRDYQYLRPNNDDPQFLLGAQTIFSGRVRNKWVDAYNRALKPSRRLLKDVRINLMLGWVQRHFPEIPMILLLRHPCAVAYSRCCTRWREDLETNFFTQPELCEDYLNPFLPILKDLETDFERHIFSWCIQTYVPLAQLNPEEVLITTYEDCVASPEYEFERIFKYLKNPFSGDVIEAAKRPSSQSRHNWRSGNASAVVLGGDLMEAWQHNTNPRDARRALDILKFFGLDQIYSLEPKPKTSSIKKFIGAVRLREHITENNKSGFGWAGSV